MPGGHSPAPVIFSMLRMAPSIFILFLAVSPSVSITAADELITICYQVPESKPPPTPSLIHEFERVSSLNVDGYSPDVAIFSPDGSHIISCSDKPAIAIWNVDTDALVFGPVRLTPENEAPHT